MELIPSPLSAIINRTYFEQTLIRSSSRGVWGVERQSLWEHPSFFPSLTSNVLSAGSQETKRVLHIYVNHLLQWGAAEGADLAGVFLTHACHSHSTVTVRGLDCSMRADWRARSSFQVEKLASDVPKQCCVCLYIWTVCVCLCVFPFGWHRSTSLRLISRLKRLPLISRLKFSRPQ